MLQDNLRSAVYSSLKKSLHVPLEDSDEAGQCRTGRKSKNNSTEVRSAVMKRAVSDGEINPCLGSKEEETMPLSSFQLKQISQGADKLNTMIESWSKAVNSDGQSGDIARDLWKEALDLQESLLMLGNLQDASKLTPQAKRKQNLSIKKIEDSGKEVDVNSRRRNSVDGYSRNFVGQWDSVDGYPRNFVGQRDSVDGYSRNFVGQRDSIDGSLNFVVQRHSVDGSSRRKSMDEFSRDFVGGWNSFDRPSKNGIELQRSVDGCSRSGIELPRRSVEGLSRKSVGPRNYADGSSKKGTELRKSVDSSSSDCIEELRKVIRDNLYKQNRLSVTIEEEMAASGRLSCDSFPDGRFLTCVPSSGFESSYSDRKARPYDSLSSASRQKEVKMPNLIAKLMGLEVLPSETTQKHTQIRELKNTLSSRRPAFEIDIPKGGKAEFTEKKVEPEHKTLKEIIETMQFKGLLKSNHAEDLKLRSRLMHTSDLLKERNKKGLDMKKSDDELPPIVIIKPLRFSSSKKEIPESKQTVNKLEPKESKILETRNESSNKIESKIMDIAVESNKTIETVALNCKQLEKEKTKTTKNEMQKPLTETRVIVKEVDKTISEEKQKNMQSADEPSNPVKASIPLSQKKRDAAKVPKKAQEMLRTMQEVVRVPKKSEDQKNPVKEISKSMVESQAPVKKIGPKPSKLENKATPRKNHTSGQKHTSQNHNVTSSTRSTSQNSIHIRKKNQRNTTKPANETAVMNSANVIEQSKEGSTEATCEIHSESATTSILPTDQHPSQAAEDVCILPSDQLHAQTAQNACILPGEQLLAQTAQNACQIQKEGDNEGKCETVCGATQIEGNSEHEEKEANQSANAKAKIGRTKRPDLRQLLLSSPSFANSAKELFNLHIDQNMVCPTNVQELASAKSSKFLLDCVNELMRHKRRGIGQWNHPMILAHPHMSEVNVTVDKLLDEVIDGIEILEHYNKVGAGAVGKDGLYSILGKDIRCKGLVGNGLWDLGWLNGFSLEDADEVLGEVEQHVLDLLINEIVAVGHQ